MTFDIPITCDPDGAPQDVATVLDGVPFVLRLQWCARADVWRLTVLDAAETVLLGGLTLRNNVALLLPFKADARLPQGELLAVAAHDAHRDAGKGELGGRVALSYVGAWA